MSNKDISSFQIDHSKIWTDGEKYFSLFEKHIPELNAGQKVLVYAIDNLDVICKLMDRGNGAEFWIFGNSDVNAGAKALGYDFNEILDGDFSKTYNILDMKFDCIIMNPPYDRGLHIKILNEATKHIAKNGKVVSLQPISKWQEAKLFHKVNPVESMNVCTRISMDEAKTLFGIEQRCELGILANAASDIQVLDNAKFLDKIWKKLDVICDITLKSKLEDNDLDFPVSFGMGCTIAGHGGHGKACWRITGYSEEASCRSGKIGHSMRFNAKNKMEQHLVWKFYQNPIMRFIYKEFGFGGIPYSIIPFIDQFKDVNGKTPLDYEWTTFDLCKFFDINAKEFEEIVASSLRDFLYDDEQKIIEDTMAKYK